MTRKDYTLIADYLRIAERSISLHTSYASYIEWQSAQLAVAATIHAVADALASENSQFDRLRFMTAARITGDEAGESYQRQVQLDRDRHTDRLEIRRG